jgi:CRISPR-associated endonuclease/helicase Cas3
MFDVADQTGISFHLARSRWWRTDGKRDPIQAVAELLSAARAAFPAAFSDDGNPIHASPRLQHHIAGLLMLADWLGSHRSFFPLDRSVKDAIKDSSARATAALQSVGLDAARWQADLSLRPATFEERFGFPPHPLQGEMDSLPIAASLVWI